MADLANTGFQRPSLRGALRQSLKMEIVTGRLAPGSRLVEVSLADQLQVSRTPLREALIALERDGFVSYSPGRGFLVCELSGDEVREIYPIIDHLESLALRLCPPPGPQRVRRLERINEELATSAEDDSPEDVAESRVALDRLWHQTLVEECPNRRLRELIGQLYDKASRYEFAFWLANGDRPYSVTEHRAIIANWSNGDLEAAIHRMTDHWQAGIEMILDLLSTGDGGDPHLP